MDDIALFVLKNFIALDVDELRIVWEFRNNPKISKFMKKKFITLEEHFDFIEKLKNDTSKQYFLVLDEKQIIGVIDFINITVKSCEFGLYQNPNLRGFGQTLMQIMLQYALKDLRVEEITACAFNSNYRAVDLYLKNGFQIIKKDKNLLYFVNRDLTKSNSLYQLYKILQ